ncbi:MAG: helix-turn-helix transcriptional regulator [Bacteroidota bacterium]|nr:helix-turn-helix transcriptional regulator [Bacteroidota bacterium]
MKRLAINNILKLENLKSEIEHERASSLYLRLRKQEKEDGSYALIREHLKNLIVQYEANHWSDELKITDEQVEESDLAETLVRAENEFNYKRKEFIKNRLKELGLKQNDLAKILGHRKGYMSELINGLRPFSKEDIVIINRLLKISLDALIPPFIKQDKVAHIKKTLKTIRRNKIKLTKKDFDLQLT